MDKNNSKFLIIVDISTEPYSTHKVLLGIFGTKEEAIKWIREHPLINVFNKRYSFKKHLYQKEWWNDDEKLFDFFVSEFTGDPLTVGCYIE